MYSWPSVPVGSSFVNSINHVSKIFRKKIPERFQKPNLNLSHTISYLYTIYIVFTTSYIAFTLFNYK